MNHSLAHETMLLFMSTFSMLSTSRNVQPGANRPALGVSNTVIYAGTYTEGTGSKGIYAFRKEADGSLLPLGCVARATNPAFLSCDPERLMLYAVEETLGHSGADGAILAYHMCPLSGRLTYSGRVSSGGVGPCFLALRKDRRSLLFANYHGGSIGSVRLSDDGTLDGPVNRVVLSGSSIHPERQTTSHPHAIVPCCEDTCAVVADLGADRLHLFGLTPDGHPEHTPIATRRVPAGSGPRHVAVHPDDRTIYVIHEISSTISVHRLNRKDISEALQVLPTAEPGDGSVLDAAALAISPDGRRIYTSTRRSNTIRVFSIDASSATLSFETDMASAGDSPHSLCFDETGDGIIVANYASGELALFTGANSRGVQLKSVMGVGGISSAVCVRLSEPRNSERLDVSRRQATIPEIASTSSFIPASPA